LGSKEVASVPVHCKLKPGLDAVAWVETKLLPRFGDGSY